MFGSEAVSAFVSTRLLADATVTAAVGQRVFPLSVAPSDAALPACLHYAEAGDYGGPINAGAPISAERLRYVVRLLCAGWSSEPIAAAAAAMLAALNGASGAQGEFFVTMAATGEWPLTTVLDGGEPFRQLGCFFQAEVAAGG